jgi:hypothetical protein
MMPTIENRYIEEDQGTDPTRLLPLTRFQLASKKAVIRLKHAGISKED